MSPAQQSKTSPRGGARRSRPRVTAPRAPDTISPRWLAGAFAISVLVAGVCGYLTFCALFLQGQWQLVLHPARPGAPLPRQIGTAAPELVHFGVDASGQPQRTGVFLRGDEGGAFRGRTVLYLPSGDGSLSAETSRLADLQLLGLDVFAVDYRGYGLSSGGHPSQRRLEEDAAAALRYLLVQRQLHAGQVVIYGVDVGGYLAAQLAENQPEIGAIILDRPRFDILDEVVRDPRVRLLPVRLLFHDTFAVRPLLQRVATPKLIFSDDRRPPAGTGPIAPPGMTVSLRGDDASHWKGALERFLDQLAAPSTFPPQAP